MNDRLREFLGHVASDPALKARVEAAVAGLEGEALAQKGAELAHEAGFDVAPEDFAPAAPAPAGELDEAELAAVAGGKQLCVCVLGGGGKQEDESPCVCVAGGLGVGDAAAFYCFCVVGGGGD